MHLVSKISKSPSFYVKFWFWLVQNANLIFAGLYLHRHPAEQAKTDSLRLTPLLENRKNAIECLNASSSLKFSGLRCYLLIWVRGAILSQKKAEKRKKKGPCEIALSSAPLFYKRLHQRPPSLYFRVWAGPEMIIPDMNSSTAISKLILLSLLLVARLARAFLWLL